MQEEGAAGSGRRTAAGEGPAAAVARAVQLAPGVGENGSVVCGGGTRAAWPTRLARREEATRGPIRRLSR